MSLKRLSLLTLLGLFVFISSSQAQILKKVQRSLEKKANEKVDEVLNGKNSADARSTEPGDQEMPPLEEIYSFQAGDSIIFATDFKNATLGRMPRGWKSSGSGSITTVEGAPGNWLLLSEKSTYKIDSLFNTPGNFTIEFDLITRSDESADIGSMSFGFARDNSVKNHLVDAYNGNAITNTQLHFHNQEITSSSSDTEKYNTIEFPLANYANDILHISIAVEAENLSVYVNKSKVLDTKMFNPGVKKIFYLTAPFSYDQRSKVYFGNFVMATN